MFSIAFSYQGKLNMANLCLYNKIYLWFIWTTEQTIQQIFSYTTRGLCYFSFA